MHGYRYFQKPLHKKLYKKSANPIFEIDQSPDEIPMNQNAFHVNRMTLPTSQEEDPQSEVTAKRINRNGGKHLALKRLFYDLFD